MVWTTKRFGYESEPKRDNEDLLQFGEGLSAGIDTTMGTLGGVRSIFNSITGDEEEALEYLNYAQQKFQEASQSGGTVTSIEDIDGAADFIRWATYSAGTILPSIATSIAGGGIGGAVAQGAAKKFAKDRIQREVKDAVEGKVSERVRQRIVRETLDADTRRARTFGQGVGAFGASAAQNTGATFVDIYEETGIEAPDVALAAGVVAGALDSVLPFVALKKIMPDTVFSKFKDGVADKLVQNGGVTRRVLFEGTRAAGLEGFTEAGQELIQATAVGMMRNDPQGGFGAYLDEFLNNISNPDDQLVSQLLNAAAVGAIGGATTGGVTGALNRQEREAKDVRQPREEAAPEPSEEPVEAGPEATPDIDQLDPEARSRVEGAQARQRAAALRAQGLPDQPVERETATPEEAQARQRAAARRAQGLPDQPVERETTTPEEARNARYEADLNESLRRSLRARRVINEIIPVSIFETGNATPEENALAEREIERLTVIPSGPTIELGPDRTMESLEGKTVDYQGIRGILTRRADGVFTVVTPEDDVVVESGESEAGSTAAAMLGVRPVDIDVDTPAPEIQYNPEDQTFVARGKTYRYIDTRRNESGEAIAIDAETMNGESRVFKSQRVIKAMESAQANLQMAEMQQAVASAPAQFDDLPTDLQMAVYEQREAVGSDPEVDEVTQEEVEAAIQAAPPEVQADLRAQTEALFARTDLVETPINATFTDNDQWREFEGSIVRAGEKPLEQRQQELDVLAGQSVKQPNGDDAITIPSEGLDQVAERISTLMQRPLQFAIDRDGKMVMEEVGPSARIADMGGDSDLAVEDVKQAVFDLISNGMPSDFVSLTSAIAAHSSRQLPSIDGAATRGGISLDIKLLGNSRTETGAKELRWTLAHEGWHVIDLNYGISESLPSFDVEVIFSGEGPTLVAGDIVTELYENYQNETELGRVFTYPFNELARSVDGLTVDVDALATTMKREVFAQLGAIYVSNPRLLKSQAPQAYEVIRTIRDNPQLATGEQDGDIQNTEAQVQPEGTGVQGEVRPPAVSGRPEVEADGGAGEAGNDGLEAGQADQGVGGETQQEAGGRDRRVVRPEELSIKRSANFATEGTYDVTFPDGSVEQIYRDTDQFSSPTWQWDGAPQGSVESMMGIGSNRAEAVQRLIVLKGFDLPKQDGALFMRSPMGLESARQTAAENSYPNQRPFKVDLQQKSLDEQARMGLNLREDTDEANAYLKDMVVGDAQEALIDNSNAIGWYDRTVGEAMDTLSLIHPEINTDQNAKFAFTFALANTSNGLKVDKNFELAEKAYQSFKQTGQFPTDIGIGNAGSAINKTFQLYNDMVAEYGTDFVRELFNKKTTVGELKKAGFNVTGEWVNTEVYGSAIIGPKIGNGFFSNLNGKFDQLTMDRWLRRTWGRWTGTLIGERPDLVSDKTKKIRDIVMRMTAEEKRSFSGLGVNIRTRTNQDVIDTANAIQKASMLPENRDVMNQTELGANLRKAGNGLAKDVDGQIEAPTAAERNRIRKVFNEALAELKQTYPEMTMADLQALLWYPEKRLYDGARSQEEFENGYEDAEAPDYANAARNLAQKLGVDSDRRSAGTARSRDVDEQGSAAESGQDQGAAEQVVETIDVGKPNTKVRPSVQRAYAALKAGQITRQEYDEAVLETIRPYEAVPAPATRDEMFEALDKRKREKIETPIGDGEEVGLRLDIPAYEQNGVWVPTLHRSGEPTSHRATASITGADFTRINQKKSLEVMEGGTKSPFAQIRGSFVNRTDAENTRLAQQYLNDPEWRQVGFDPRRHSTFYDRRTGEYIARADEVIQVGPLVLAKNATTLNANEVLFSRRLSTGATFSGKINAKHGYRYDPEDGQTPIPNFVASEDFGGFRYDGDGGAFGSDGVYLEDASSPLYFNRADMYGFSPERIVDVEATFEKAFVFTPATVQELRQVIGVHPKDMPAFVNDKPRGAKIVSLLKERGYDGLIVKDFKSAEMSNYKEAQEQLKREGMGPPSDKNIQEASELVQPQVFAFYPERLKVDPDSMRLVSEVSEFYANRDETPLFQKRLSGQTQSHEEASETGELMTGEPSTASFTLDDETRVEKFLIKWQDKFLVLKKFEKQAAEVFGVKELPLSMRTYDAETLSAGKIKTDFDALEDEYVKPIGDLLRANDIEMDEVGSYLMAKHASERNRYIASINASMPDGGSGMTTAQAQTYLANAENKEALEEISSLVYKMLQDNRDRLVEFGLVDEAGVDAMQEQYQFYVPLKGFASEEDGVGGYTEPRGLPKGFSVGGKEFMSALGRDSKADNPLLWALSDVENKIVRARRNEVAQRFLRTAEAVQAAGSDELQVYRDPADYPSKRIKQNGEVVVKQMDAFDMADAKMEDGKTPRFMSVKENGREVFVEIKHLPLARAMHNVGAEAFENLVGVVGKGVGALQVFQNFRRNMLINYNPSWFFINPLRDLQTGLMYSLAEESKDGGFAEGEKLTADILKGYLPAGRAYFKNLRGGKTDTDLDDFFEEYQKSGAPTGMTLTRDIDEQKKRLAAIIQEGSLKSNIRAVGNLVEDLNTSSENVVRFATFVAARRNGIAEDKAALLAKNLTVNFNRKGELSSGLNLFYLFFNAAVQGTANIAQAMTGSTATGGRTKAQIAVAGIALISYLVTEHNLMATEEDEDGESLYNDLTDYDKLMSWNIVNADGKSFTQIPLPYGYGLFHTLGRLGAEWANESTDGAGVASEIASATVHHLLPPPLGFLGSVGKVDDGVDFVQRATIDLLPDVFEPATAIGFNKTHFGSPIYIEQNALMSPTPDSSRSKRTTEEVYKDTAEFFNSITGGSLYREGGIDVSPDTMKYLIEYTLGGVGRFFNRSADVTYRAMNETSGDEVLLGDFPIFRYFNGNPSKFEDRAEYYENSKSAQQIFSEAKESRGNDLERLKDRFGSVIKLEPLYKETQKQLRALRRQRKQIEKAQADPTRAYEQIEKLEERMDALYDRFNKRYREATK